MNPGPHPGGSEVDPSSLIYPLDVHSQRAELDENVRGNARVGVSAGSSRSVAARDADSRSPSAVPTLERDLQLRGCLYPRI